ncbi:MAG: MFS transporter [Dehalococcoidia bacterium]|nr:MFS transporter [Dehalococcoidia bacterium]
MAASSRPSLRKAFVSLRHRDFRILFASSLASNSAMGMQMLARGFLAFDLTGSFAIMGVISFSFAIPMFLFSLIGGATADRMDKRALMIITQFGTLLTALATGLMITTGVITVPLLFAVGVVQGTVMAFRMPVQTSLLAEIVPENELMSAMAISNAAMNATRPLAPMVAGLMLAAWGIDTVYYAQVLMYVVTLLFVVQLPRSTSHLAGTEERGGVLAESAGGLRYVFSDKTILLLLFMGAVPMLLTMPPMMTMLPGFAVAELGLGGDGLGYLMALSGIGSLFGSFLIATLTEFPRKPLLQMVAGIGSGVGLLALGLGAKAFGIPGAVVALAILGLFQGPYMTLNMTMVITRARPEYIGRVMSVFMLLFGLMPFMSYPMGILADRITASSTFALAGLALIGFMALMFVLNPKYTFSKVEAQGSGDSLSGSAWSVLSGGGGGGGGMGGGGMGMGGGRPRPGAAAAGRGPAPPSAAPTPAAPASAAAAAATPPAQAPPAPQALPAPPTPRPASPLPAQAGLTERNRAAAANGDPAGVSEPAPVRPRRSRPREYMAGPVARASRDYMGSNGDGADGAGPSGDGTSGDGTSERVRDERAAAGYGLHRIRPPANGNASAPGTAPDDDGSEADGTGGANAEDPDRIELPPRPRAGGRERTAVAALTASVVAGVLSSLVFRKPSNGE